MINYTFEEEKTIHNHINFSQLKHVHGLHHPQNRHTDEADGWIDTSIVLHLDAAGQLNILGHNCYPFGMDGTGHCILHEA